MPATRISSKAERGNDRHLVTDITHFLNEKGEMITELPQARKLGGYIPAIIVVASYPEAEYPAEYRVSCRRRPNRKPCLEEIVGYAHPEMDEIV